MDKTIRQIKRTSLKDQVYESLQYAIVNLELQPGQRLNDNDLAKRFGVSRTPVREALKRLEDEGLVESFPGSSTRVTEVVEEEAKDAFTVVAVLHALAAKLSVPRLTEQHFRQMEEANEALRRALEENDPEGAIRADSAFHAVFLKAADNGEIIRALERIEPKIHRLTRKRFGSVDRISSVGQHEDIMAAAKLKNVEEVSRLTEANWLTLGRLLSADR